MNWIHGIQIAIDYIENNILDDIDFDKVAQEAYSSSFHFQRVFSILCGYQLGDYIRMRRLSLAGEELSKGNSKIIDVALKYGYDSPESFSRAFTKFHGVSPMKAKHGGNVRLFTPLYLKLILTGGQKMDYRIEKRNEFKIVCKRQSVDKPLSAQATSDISKIWEDYRNEGTINKLISYLPENPTMKGLLGVCFTSKLDQNKFPYGIGVEYDGRKVDDEFDIVTIPAYTYAVFTCKGKMPEAFANTYNRIVTEFFPQSSTYEYGESIEFEVYPSHDILNPNYTCEIWIAVKKVK